MKKLSLQWRLTLMTAAVTAIACIALTILIGRSADTKMDEIEEIFVSVEGSPEVKIANPEDIEVYPEYLNRLEDHRQNFHLQSLAAMAVIILISSLATYFAAGRALSQLKDFSQRIESIQAQNLSQPLNFTHLPRELQRLSLSFNQMLARLEQSFTSQKQFSANAAHELRTPLAIMQAKLEVFDRKSIQDSDASRELFELIRTQTQRLSGIVSELLEMSSLQTAKRDETISLKELTEEVFCDLADMACEKKIQLIQEPGYAAITGNETLIYRVIFNLVENGIKYNREGGAVRVSISQKAQQARLTVSDTGIGIPPQYREQIFEPFFRVDKSRSREMGGAGIGLAMVKSIAELHGGSIRAEEAPEGGSSLICTFPAGDSKD